MAVNIETISIEELRGDFFAIMEEACKDDMDDAGLELYEQRHSQDESQDQEAA